MTTISNTYGVTTPDDNYGVQTPSEAPQEPCMPPPNDMPTGDIGAAVAALIVISADQSKASARQLQKSEELMQAASQQREINAMKAQASLQMGAAIVGIVGNTIDGVCMAAGAEQAGGIVKGIGDGVGGALQAEASFKGADAKAFDMQADAEKRGADASHEVADDAKKLADKAIDFYQQWTQDKAAATQAATHRS